MKKAKIVRKAHKKTKRKSVHAYAKERNLMMRYAALGGVAGAVFFTVIGFPFVYHLGRSIPQAVSFLLLFGGLVGVLCGVNVAFEKARKIKSVALTFFHKLI